MKKKDYKAIFCDFDGTLFRSDYTISDRNRKAIIDFISRGGLFFIATGRLFSSIRPYALDLGLKGEIIVYQGGGIFDVVSGKQIWIDQIEYDISYDLLRRLEDDKVSVQMFYYNDNCYIESKNSATEMFAKVTNIKQIVTGCKLSEYIKKEKISPVKVLAMMKPENIDSYRDKLINTYGGKLNFQKSQEVMLEMVKKEVSKGVAVAKICEKYNLSNEDIICIGDADNDNSMLEYAGLGVAPQNAMDTTKNHADLVGPSNDDDLVAYIIDNYCI